MLYKPRGSPLAADPGFGASRETSMPLVARVARVEIHFHESLI